MKYNNKIIKVFMEYNPNILFTAGDIVWGIDPSFPNLLQLCTKDQLTPGITDKDYWRNYESEAYLSRIKTMKEWEENTDYKGKPKDPDRLITVGVLNNILKEWRGDGYNYQGSLSYLDGGSDLNNMQNTCRYMLAPNKFYLNVPTLKIPELDEGFCIMENVNLQGYQFQQITLWNELEQYFITFYRVKNMSNKWYEWQTFNLAELNKDSDKFIREVLMPYRTTIIETESALNAIRDTTSKLVYNFDGKLSQYEPANINTMEDGCFNICLISNGKQVISSFTQDDTDFVRYANSTMHLSSSSDNYKFSLINDGGIVKLKIETAGDPVVTIKLLRAPINKL